ncbi:hypothetical protein PPSIR1_13890 [Plesiocystis pacifica SIR-1]|uniref:Fibrinogen C-terminal domain-containing protein n=1 Tax=Plesiocystis pacifica SIR-1 TaxID=391625 RepID=A6G8W3_9BACT|nr:fibrinogen-like YCDxxxxGGGW domain-containing protein [Plesiocystis pacifica]EDM77649.1 hypothetical protein PPSIR1_13890 [Plesiocystis pacifica SIR-1]
MATLPSPANASRRVLFAPLALAFACLLPGCFSVDKSGQEPEDTDTSTDSDDSSCVLGTEGCPCTPGGSCDPGLVCEGSVCVVEDEPVCGNGEVEEGEECDDANDDDTDECTSLCAPPSCSDGIASGDETDVDCGGSCEQGCAVEGACVEDDDCAFPNCNPAGMCEAPLSCAHLQLLDPNAEDGVYLIDIDGTGPGSTQEAFEVLCRSSNNGGGWTLGMTASDDGTATWTWNNRAMLANEVGEVGSLDAPTSDFMSLAYHVLPFTDVLFVHQPSGVWAHYPGVGDGSKSYGAVIAEFGSPVCDPALAGNSFELAPGSTLSATGPLCDTDLYFNLGDHDGPLTDCQDLGSPSNTATFGPVWSANWGDGCPFDDPAESGIGPHGPCGVCPPEFAATEFPHLGFANALDLNSGQSGAGENYLQVYVR